MNQDNKQSSQQLELAQSLPQLDKADISDDEIQSSQVQICEKMLGKLKKIYKAGKIVKFKQKSQKNNNLFHLMSQFFNRKQIAKQSKEQKKKKSKLQRTKARQHNPLFSIQQTCQQKKQQPQKNEANSINVRCHICNALYSNIHEFYGFLCPSCATFNMEKRQQRFDMKGLVALVTGGRIKIGYQICLRLLRQGATVIATSRFSKDCLLRYQKQVDYAEWKNNLVIYQCDFLSQMQVSSLIQFIRSNYKKLDILINNAAQTLVRPKEFYTKQLQNELFTLDEDGKIVKNSQMCLFSHNEVIPSLTANTISIKPGEIDLENSDEFGQPLDKRETNSWVQKIEDVPLIDCYTTQVINSIVPFYLISQLKSVMKGQTPSWILNVSSMEGVFDRINKQEFHPHTNMAKAALNMITRTSAQQFKKHNIFMNSIDTGWVTNENPYPIAQVMQNTHYFRCPLDCLDGAMRVLDPIYLGLAKKQYPYGQFLKNYLPSKW